MTTAQEVFELAMSLMDELNESTGAAITADTREYMNRAVPILNILRGELYRYSDTYEVTIPGKRPIPAKLSEIDDEIDLDDYICQSVLPYGLAAHLLMQEDLTSASYFQQRYEELKRDLERGLPTVSEDIEDVYGGIEYGEFPRW
jgi:hypothetical protein